MKITILISTLIAASMLLVACDNAPKKTNENIANATEKAIKLNQALNDSIQQFKKESEMKIDEYQKEIAVLKTKLNTKKKSSRVLYEKKIDELKDKSNALKGKLNDYKEEGQEKWNSFKTEFNHDLDEFGKAFKDLTVDNVK